MMYVTVCIIKKSVSFLKICKNIGKEKRRIANAIHLLKLVFVTVELI